MTWEIVLGLSSLFGFIVAVVKTVIPLTNAIVRLTERIDRLSEEVKEMELHKEQAHKRLWDYNEKQDAILAEHERKLNQNENNRFAQ